MVVSQLLDFEIASIFLRKLGILDFEIEILCLEFEILNLEFEIPDVGIWNP